ncbi:MAG: porin family protein [Daejeonella sp.]
MKKVVTLALGCVLAGSVLAQTSEIKYGVKAGVNFAKTVFSGSGYTSEAKDASKFLTSFHFSGLVDVPISNSFSVQPGLSLSGKGQKYELENDNSTTKLSGTFVMYLELPVNAVFKIKGFYIGAGPYAAYALAGKIRSKAVTDNGGVITTDNYEEDIDFGNDKNNDQLKAIDFGLNVLAGYQLTNGFNIGANYGLGLSNLAPGGASTDKKTNSVISVSVGFMF